MSGRMVRRFGLMWRPGESGAWQDITCDVTAAGEELGGRAIARQAMACGTDAVDLGPAEDSFTVTAMRSYDPNGFTDQLRAAEGTPVQFRLWPDPVAWPNRCEEYTVTATVPAAVLKVGEWDTVTVTMPTRGRAVLAQAYLAPTASAKGPAGP
jgi:hypothetical protein